MFFNSLKLNFIILVMVTTKIFESSFRFRFHSFMKILMQLLWMVSWKCLTSIYLHQNQEFQITMHFESITMQLCNCIYVLKFENMTFHDIRFQTCDIKETCLTPYIMPSSNDEDISQIFNKVSIYGNDKLLLKGVKRLPWLQNKLWIVWRKWSWRRKLVGTMLKWVHIKLDWFL